MQDAKVVDHACTALSRIAESYARYPDRLDMLCNHGLISNAVQLVRLLSTFKTCHETCEPAGRLASVACCLHRSSVVEAESCGALLRWCAVTLSLHTPAAAS